jgi:hypothetical protein
MVLGFCLSCLQVFKQLYLQPTHFGSCNTCLCWLYADILMGGIGDSQLDLIGFGPTTILVVRVLVCLSSCQMLYISVYDTYQYGSTLP